jgi:lipopolysaccharide export system permease protein
LASGLSKSFGLSLGLLFLFMNYALMSVGKIFGETGAYPPIIGMWVPNGVTLLIAAYFFYRSADNRTFRFNCFRRRGSQC